MNAASAAPHEVPLVEQTLESRFTEEKPERLVGDRAYDSDLLDVALAEGHRDDRPTPKEA